MVRVTPRRLLVFGGSASLVAQAAAPLLADIDGVLPWAVLAIGVIGSVLLVLLAGIGISATEALGIRDRFQGSDIHEHRKWIRWFESQRTTHGERLDEHDERLRRLEQRVRHDD